MKNFYYAIIALLVSILIALLGIFFSIPRAHECGACGAKTFDVYFVRNLDDTEFVGVCPFCYQTFMENM